MRDSLFCFCVALILSLFVSVAIRFGTQNPEDLFQERVRKVTYEGHEYLIYDQGVCHYPGCKCLTKTESKGENDDTKAVD